jgi:hypothetical protein
MTELKTLKDFRNTIERDKVCWELKQEAIKWIKSPAVELVDEVLMKWIKHFFNITEEELK